MHYQTHLLPCLLFGLVVLLAGCTGVTEPVEPAAEDPVQRNDDPAVSPDPENYPFPPVSENVLVVYDQVFPPGRWDDPDRRSRYVLYDGRYKGGSFEYQTVSKRGDVHLWTGWYSRSGSLVDFYFDKWGNGANGIVSRGVDHLEVEYSFEMGLIGFSEAEYEINDELSNLKF